MNDIFVKSGNADSRWTCNNGYLFLPHVNTVHYGHDSLRFFGCKLWDIIPQGIKALEDIETFKTSLKKWVPNLCPCRLCRDYVGGVGFIKIV